MNFQVGDTVERIYNLHHNPEEFPAGYQCDRRSHATNMVRLTKKKKRKSGFQDFLKKHQL